MCKTGSIASSKSLLACLVATVLGAGCGSSSTCPSGWTNGIPPLHTGGRVFKDPAENVVILRGVDIVDTVDLDTVGGSMNSESLLALLADPNQGFYARIVRITVLPKIWKALPDTYFKDHLEPAVRQATALGLYVIIDWHEIADVETVADETAAFWEEMAPKFADHSNVLYEVFNEPMNLSNTSWTSWKQYAQPWVDQIRRDAPDRIILIGGPYWSQQIGGASSDPFVGDNLAYVGHIYPEGVGPGDLLGETGPIAQAASNRPVIITEWGFNDNATQTSFGEPLKAFIEAHGLSWTAWCATGIWTEMMFDASWNLLVGEGKMGGFVKDWLAQRKDQDQPTQTAGKCATMTTIDGASSMPRDASPEASVDIGSADALLCEGTASGPGNEECPTQPYQSADNLPCHDIGRICDYVRCGDLVTCMCQSDEVDAGPPRWQCMYNLR